MPKHLTNKRRPIYYFFTEQSNRIDVLAVPNTQSGQKFFYMWYAVRAHAQLAQTRLQQRFYTPRITCHFSTNMHPNSGIGGSGYGLSYQR